MSSLSGHRRTRVTSAIIPPDVLEDHHELTRRSFMIGIAGTGLGLATYAGTFGRHRLEITERTFKIRNLPDAFQGFRMVQLSDIHLEEYTEPYFLERAIDRINDLKPEVVLLTGDFISRGPRSHVFALKMAGICAEVLTRLKAPQRFAVLGNHDAVVGPDAITQLLQAHGTPVLSDRYVAIERGQERIWLAGAKDPGVLGCDLNNAIPVKPDAPVIFMAHEPDYADAFQEHPRGKNIDLMLSGHTHGGQIRLPIVGPLVVPLGGTKYIAGQFRVKDMQLYVNRGLGTVGLPFRFDCPAEITHITLERA